MSALANRLERSGSRVRLVADGPDLLAVIRTSDGQRVGEISVENRSESIYIERLCIETPFRSYGAGSEAAWLLVAAAQEAGIERLLARAHPDLGLSVYFWSRMGFSPRHGEGPDGGIWFERRV